MGWIVLIGEGRSAFFGEMRRPVFLLSIFLAILFCLDVTTTTMALSLGAVEMNAAMSGIVVNPMLHLLLKGALMVLVAYMAAWCDRVVPGLGTYLLCIPVFWYSIVVISNAGVIISLSSLV